ncbi:MAG TPA: hypothetical protein VKV57_06690 [bacterium]|nr:hypothetical protein [bacterium]
MLKEIVDVAQVIIAAAAVLALGVAIWQGTIARQAIAEQHRTAREQLRMMHEDLKMRLLLDYEQRFETSEMMARRRALAGHLLGSGAYKADAVMQDSTFAVIGDEVPNFFESLATMHDRKHIDTAMAFEFFYHWGLHYWVALHGFVRKDRATNGDDLWNGFQSLMDNFAAYALAHHVRVPINDVKVEDFLRQEQQAGL